MKLFEDKPRTDNKPAKYLDNIFDFYDRSNQPQFVPIRQTLNLWFERYPQEEKKELFARFKKSFSSAFYELFLHELFTKQGFSLLPHPEVPGTSKRPDFLVSGNGIEFYLEARESTDSSTLDQAAEKREARLYDTINEIDSPNFFFRINKLEFLSNQQPAGRKIIPFIEKKLTGFDPDQVQKLFDLVQDLESLPIISYYDKDINLELSILPKSIEARGKDEIRPLAITQFKFSYEGSEDSIKKAVHKKAGKYGTPDKPYIISINSTSYKMTGKHDVFNALFGSEMISYSTNPSDRDLKLVRDTDGVFFGKRGPQYTRVSGILITNVSSSNLHVANHWLVKHPFAQKDLNFDAFELSKIVVQGSKIEHLSGASIRETLEIEEDWLAK